MTLYNQMEKSCASNKCPKPSDVDLMQQMQRGEAKSLGLLYERYRRMVLAVIMTRMPTAVASELEDLCHNTFLTLWTTAPRYREQGCFSAWLSGIAIHQTRNFIRKMNRKKHLLGKFGGKSVATAVPYESSLETQLEAKISYEQILQKLPLSLRQVMLLYTVGRMDSYEIAKILEIRQKTVWTRIHRARRFLEKAGMGSAISKKSVSNE